MLSWDSIQRQLRPHRRRVACDEDHFTPHHSGASDDDLSLWWSTFQQFSGHAKFIARITALERCRRHPLVQSWWDDDSIGHFDDFLAAVTGWIDGRVTVAQLVQIGERLFDLIDLRHQDPVNYHTTAPGRMMVWAINPVLFPPPPVEAGPEVAQWWHHVCCRLAVRDPFSLVLDSIDAVDLANSLMADDPYVREFACEALEWTPSPDAILPLLAAAVGDWPDRAGLAIDRLDTIRKAMRGRVDDPRIRDGLRSAIDSPRISSRGRAIIARMLGEETALPVLLEHLRSDDPTQRTLSTNAISLAFRTSRSALDHLLASLDHEEWPVRRAAVRALAGMADHAHPAMRRLEQLALSDPSENVRISAQRALRWIRDHPDAEV